MPADDYPVASTRTLLHIVDGSLAFAGHYLHEDVHPIHTHSFVEIALVMGGAGAQRSLAGRQQLRVGDVLLLRPGVWHGYEDCRALDLYNCVFSPELLRRELAWTRADPWLGHLLWTGPYAAQRRGILTGHVSGDALAECVEHLDRLHDLRAQSAETHRGDLVGRLLLFLSCLAREIAEPGERSDATHPAVLDGMRMMEEKPAYHWTLTELATELHVAPGYLVRLFKSATGLPPMAYLSRHRVELAAARLLHTDQPINRIGESVGWPDQNYFARRFKSHYGLSASTYRERFTKPLRR
ncbi:AraC family transcriptional regulator [Paractinoplanes rishiriensis]|uniref:Transcriptional regulator n=1 Tax=Paractinoplanes rishiriensis TaxID=1050105 RepID=A0A919K3Y4_9ACTN|nr:AraC family transcriptional regulator [Actinoplanes rishiriensis]GIE98530.1 transcriptional regulator [Actinoplanes rishiriensis]